MASQTGNRGLAGSPPMMMPAMGARKNMCMRYMPKDSFDTSVTTAGALPFLGWMQVKSRKRPKVAHSTLGEQNSQLHSSSGVSMGWPGTPFHQNDQAVKAAPTRKNSVPRRRRRWRDHFRCTRM